MAGSHWPYACARSKQRLYIIAASATRPVAQLRLFEPGDPKIEQLREALAALDLNTLTPIEALLKSQELKGLV